MDDYEDEDGDNPYDGEQGANTIFIGFDKEGEALFVPTTHSDGVMTESEVREYVAGYASADRVKLTADEVKPTSMYQPKYPSWMPSSK